MTAARRALATVGPDGAVSIVAIAGLVGLTAAMGHTLAVRVDEPGPWLVAAGLAVLAALARVGILWDGRPRRLRRLAADTAAAMRVWAPFIVLYIVYRGLRPVFEAVPLTDAGPRLRAIDEAMLGVSPAWSLQHIASPWLTELMAYGYGTMFAMPLALFAVLHARRRLDLARPLALAMLIAFYVGMYCYLLVPARSPRLVYDFAVELRGAVGLYELSTLGWDAATRIPYDAFPSLHTAIAAIALAFAWRFGAIAWPSRPRAPGWLFLAHAALLWIATMYLRQHYFIDVVAGWALAWFAMRARGASY